MPGLGVQIQVRAADRLDQGNSIRNGIFIDGVDNEPVAPIEDQSQACHDVPGVRVNRRSKEMNRSAESMHMTGGMVLGYFEEA